MHRLLAILFVACAALPLRAEDPAPVNLPLPTLGGEQFWSDELVYQGWRIQQNVLTQHYRLLDPLDIRRAWGTDAQCRAAFEEWKRRDNIQPPAGQAVITLHGLI